VHPIYLKALAVAAARFDRGYVCNHSDDSGRYSYAAQPGVCRWNCEKLAEALAPVLPVGRARAELDTFDREYDRRAAVAGLQVGAHVLPGRQAMGCVEVLWASAMLRKRKLEGGLGAQSPR
jgi:hypothetical protein